MAELKRRTFRVVDPGSYVDHRHVMSGSFYVAPIWEEFRENLSRVFDFPAEHVRRFDLVLHDRPAGDRVELKVIRDDVWGSGWIDVEDVEGFGFLWGDDVTDVFFKRFAGRRIWLELWYEGKGEQT